MLGSIKAENWRAWNFRIENAAGAEIARITKTFEGFAKTLFTTADNYVVQIHRQIAASAARPRRRLRPLASTPPSSRTRAASADGQDGRVPDPRPRRRSIARWRYVAGATLILLTIAVVIHPGPLPGELGYVRWLQRRPSVVRELAGFVRATTGTEGALVVLVPVGWWAMVRHRARGAAAVGIALATMLVAQPTIKEIVDRPRPSPEQVEVLAEHTSKSFPSGHSMSTTTVWGAIAAVAWRRRRSVALVASVPIAITFVASAVQGVHWPTDALAGTLFGALAVSAISIVLAGGAGEVRPRR